MGTSERRGPWGVRGAAAGPAPQAPKLARAPLRELADDVDVALVDDERPGQRRLAAAEDVAVVLVQPQRVDGLVALQVGLLVDGPLQLTGLDLGRDLGVEVERADLGLAAGVLDGA